MNLDLSWNTLRPSSHLHQASRQDAERIRRHKLYEQAWMGYSVEFGNVSDEERDDALLGIAFDLDIPIRHVCSVAMDTARSEDLMYEHSVGLG
jgi:hypothetical protein